jgi:hypothetical protein
MVRKLINADRRTPAKAQNQQKRKNTGRNLNGSSTLVNSLCGVSDPFCHHTEGMRHPAGTPTNTLAYQLKTVFNLTTGADGTTYVYFNAGPSSQALGIYDSAPGDTTFIAEADTNTSIGTHPSIITNVRVVSAGIRWWPIHSLNTFRGTLTTIPISDSAELLDATNHAFSDLYNTQGAVAGPLNPGTFILGPSDVDNQVFNPKSTTGALSTVADDWSSVLICVQGANNTLYMAFEAVINYEGQIDYTQGIRIGTSSPENQLLQSYQRNSKIYAGRYTGYIEQVGYYLKNKAMAYAKRQGIKLIGNYIAPGAGTAITAYGDFSQIPMVD